MIDINFDLQDIILSVLDEYGERITSQMKRDIRLHGKVATGNLVSSIQYEINVSDTNASLEIIAADYFRFVDQGVKGGGKLPPIQSILQWIRQKNITFRYGQTKARSKTTGRFIRERQTLETRQRDLAWAIAKSIQDKGIVGINISKSIESMEKDLNQSLTNKINNALQGIVHISGEEVFASSISIIRPS